MAYLNNEQIARAFSTHDFEAALDRLLTTVTWHNLGGHTYHGKDAVMAACRESADYLADITTVLEQERSIVGEHSIVIETRASYTEDDGSVSRVASCDIYDFEGELVVAITSYTVEL